MPSPKIFVSSTCYDLGMVREQIRSFLLKLGYEPIMSEYSDVLYDPRQHTHTSCLQEIPNADIVILFIGSRYGGTAVPEALKLVDIEKLTNSSFDVTILDEPEKLSITQLEVLKALTSSVPVFSFVDEKVWHDHKVYQKNKDFVDKISFPSIEKSESAKYIFEFLNFLRNRTEGNSLIPFSKIEDIENHLRKQWASLFQRLLQEQRDNRREERRSTNLSEQLDDLKTALLSTMENTKSRDIARNVIKFRRLIDFLRGLNFPNHNIITKGTMNFEDLLIEVDIISVVPLPEENRIGLSKTALIKSDNTFYLLRFREDYLIKISSDWYSFSILPEEQRSVIFDALSDMDSSSLSIVQYRGIPFNNYYDVKNRDVYDNSISIGKLLEMNNGNDSFNNTVAKK